MNASLSNKSKAQIRSEFYLKYKSCLTVALFLFFIWTMPGGLETSLCFGNPSDSSKAIVLPNRTIIPEPGFDSTLSAKISTSSTFPIHGYVQLHKKLTSGDRFKLVSNGITIREYLGGTNYLAEFNRSLSFDSVSGTIRHAGALQPEDKTDSELLIGNIHDWAKADSGKVKVLVFSYPAVEEYLFEKQLSNYSQTVKYFKQSGCWAIETSLESITELASEEQVKWLVQGPSPLMPLMDD